METQGFENQDIYKKEELNNPFLAMMRWMQDAESAKVKNFNTMCFATVDADGHPDARQMLVKDHNVEQGSLVFYTNGNSEKAKELEKNPFVALNTYWPELDRSIRIRGQVEYVSAEESDNYWRTRNLEAQVSSAVSNQSAPLESKENFIRQCEEVKKSAGSAGVKRPDHWHGYRVVAHSVELWFEGSEEGRIHTRVRWDRSVKRRGTGPSDISGFDCGEWSHQHLQP